MKWFINKNRKYCVQAYGKLPIYKDYINLVTRSESITWRNWMLNVFDSDNAKIPNGLWGFIFQGSGKSAPVAGLIEHSSDGIREFPISLFAVMEKTKLTDRHIWYQVVEIIKELTLLRADLKKARRVETCYDILTAKTLHIKFDTFSGNRLAFDFRDQLLDSQNIPPFFFVLPDLSGNLGFMADAKNSGNNIIEKWRAL